MGEVYRARDTRLKRDVAIKVLPADVAGNPERLGRFEREAHLLAALSHPGIGAIHGLEEADGTPAIVMELVEGEPLSDRMARGALPVDEAVAIARQVAGALEYAHERGIIHRDLKPANIVVSREGVVKVLDFGLAKAITGEAVESDVSDATHSPTLTSPATRAGVILGTAAYMAPEQARGKSVDRRADIWAFGVVLFEMLTGRRLFEGETVSDTIAAILTRTPDFAALPAGTPAHVRRLLARCLERDAKQRLRDIGEARVVLESAVDDTPARPPVSTGARRAAAVPWTVAVVAVLAAAGWILVSSRTSPEEPDPIRYSQRTFRPQTIFQALYAPDGQTIFYSAASEGNTPHLFSLRAEYTEPLQVSEQPLQLLSISSRGELAVLTHPNWLAHRLCYGTLARMPMSGGAPREVVENVIQAVWDPEGEELATLHYAGGLYRLEYPPGRVLQETSAYFSDLRFSPDGKHIAYFEHPVRFDDRGGIAMVDLEGKRTLLSDGYWGLEGIAWAADGRTVYFSAGTGYSDFTIYAAPLGGEVRVAAQSAGGLVIHDIAPGGQWLATRDDLSRVMMVRAGRDRREVNLAWQELSQLEDLSSDGQLLLFTESGTSAGANYQVCLRRTDGSPVIVLGEGGGFELSSDDRWALAGVFPNRVIAYPTGPGKAIELNTKTLERVSVASWLGGAKQVLLVGGRRAEPERCYVLDIDSGAPPRAITAPGVIDAYPAPDGRRLLLQDVDLAWWIGDVDSSVARTPVAGLTADDSVIRWRDDGAGVYVYARTRVPTSIDYIDPASGTRKPVVPIEPDVPGVLYVGALDIAADETVYGYSALIYDSRMYTMEGAR
jgi:serine/threonine protein kinase